MFRRWRGMLGIIGVALMLCACAATGDKAAMKIPSARDVASQTLDALAKQTMWKEKWTATGIERSVEPDGKIKSINHTFRVSSTLQAPDRIDSTTSNMTGPGTSSRQIQVGKKSFLQEPTGTGKWRELTAAPVDFKDASVRVGAGLRLFIDWTRLELTEDVTCGSVRCYRLLVDGAPLGQGAVASKTKIEIVIDRTTMLPLRQTLTLTYDSDGVGTTDDFEFYDYGQPNDIRPPI
jgi:hypothetical protein